MVSTRESRNFSDDGNSMVGSDVWVSTSQRDLSDSRSAKMVFQSLLPVLIMKGVGAHVHFKNERSDPLFDYMQFIFLPFVNRHCGLQYQFDRDPIRGDIDLQIHPATKTPKPFSVLNSGSVCSFVGVLWGNLTNNSTVPSLLAFSFNTRFPRP
jgi:hypothetical protein